MINFARRRLLQFIGAGSLAVPALPLAIPKALAAAAPVAALAGGAPTAGLPSTPAMRLGAPIAAMLEEAMQRHNEQLICRRNSRGATGGFDPDIACMRSWSATTKMRKQIERDDSDLILNRRLNKVRWG